MQISVPNYVVLLCTDYKHTNATLVSGIGGRKWVDQGAITLLVGKFSSTTAKFRAESLEEFRSKIKIL